MMLASVGNFITGALGKTSLVMKAKSPELLMVGGIVAIAGGIVLACRATLKANDIMEEASEQRRHIDGVKERYDANPEAFSSTYTDEEYKRDKDVIKVQTIVKVGLQFIPVALTVGAGIAMIAGGQHILKVRNAALLSAYKALEQSFVAYRQRVIDKYGAEEDYLFKNGLAKRLVAPGEYTKDGVLNDTEGAIEEYDQVDKKASLYQFEWKRGACTSFPMPGKDSSIYCYTWLTQVQQMFNHDLSARGHVFLNDVLDRLGYSRVKHGWIVGWKKNGKGDGVVDFGIGLPANARFVDGYTNECLLNFNVDGPIEDVLV